MKRQAICLAIAMVFLVVTISNVLAVGGLITPPGNPYNITKGTDGEYFFKVVNTQPEIYKYGTNCDKVGEKYLCDLSVEIGINNPIASLKESSPYLVKKGTKEVYHILLNTKDLPVGKEFSVDLSIKFRGDKTDSMIGIDQEKITGIHFKIVPEGSVVNLDNGEAIKNNSSSFIGSTLFFILLAGLVLIIVLSLFLLIRNKKQKDTYAYLFIPLLIIGLFSIPTVLAAPTGSHNVTITLDGGFINSPENLSIFLNSDNSANLNWSIVSGVDGYYVYSSDNITKVLQLDTIPQVPVATLIGQNNNSWNDTNQLKRFYRVSSYQGALKNLSTVNRSVGQYNITITADESMFSYPIQENKTIEQAVPSSNAGSFVFLYNGTDWLYDYYNGASWIKSSGFNDINFSVGYYAIGFASEKIMKNIGVVPVGSITQSVSAGGTAGEGMFGWESISTGETIESLISSPNAGAFVFNYNGTDWLYDYYNGASWIKSSGFNTFEPTKSYYTIGFSSPFNINYNRNPY